MQPLLYFRRMKLIYSLLFTIITTTTFAGQVKNIRPGLWSDASMWFNNAVPTANDTVSLNYDIVIDINASCMFFNTNGHNVTVNSGVSFTVTGYNVPLEVDSTFTDTRDGQTYRFRHIGTQVWMTQNLNYTAPASWCYNDNPDSCAIYGRLYQYNTALTVAPSGWHLPSDSEWTILTTYLGGAAVAGGQMKEAGLAQWFYPNSGATNSSGFSAIPSGSRNFDGTFIYLGQYASYWTSTNFNFQYAWYFYLSFNYTNSSRGNTAKNLGFSVRCVRD